MKSSAVSILTRSLSSNHIMRPSVSASEELSRKLFDRIESDSPYGSFSVANCPRNHNLNRWCNVLPFDNTRIKLCPTDEDSNDYINASKVEAPNLENKTYILTQGPLEQTVGHFWTMVWQQQVSAIVMLCRLMESGICKCARYWPATDDEDDLIRVPGRGLEVRLRDFDNSDSDFLLRNLELRHCATDSIRVITHYHYLTWPDFGVPDSTTTFLKYLNTVSSIHPSTTDSPNVIHCSAGIGRSGTFILVDACLERMRRTKKPLTRLQIVDTLMRMRAMRGGLVQTAEQLKFSLQAIEDAMKTMEFSEEANGTSLHDRKRSIDGNTESEDKPNSTNNDGSNSPPKRPKTNC